MRLQSRHAQSKVGLQGVGAGSLEKIIVVEDDSDLRDQVVTYLRLSGFETVGVGSAAELYRRMAVETFMIMVLDLRLPDGDGLSVAAYVRAHTSMGIIMVTARGDIEDRLLGRKAGADVYLPKPVDLRELVAAIEVLTGRLAPAETPLHGQWQLECGRFGLTAPNGKTAPLTANEQALLVRLTSPCGVVAPRGELLAVLGYDPDDPSNRNLDAALRRLRIKVEETTGAALPLRTVHSVGYLLSDDVIVCG